MKKHTQITGFAMGALFASLSVQCASNPHFGFEPDPATPDAAVDEDADPAVLGPGQDAAPIDASPKLDGCHIATLGINGSYPSDIFSTWLDKSNNQTAASLKDQLLTKALLSPYSMIVVLDVSVNHDYSTQEADVLRQWVEAGGGLLTLTGFRGGPEPLNVNRLLVPYKMSYDTTLVLNKGIGTTWPITHWQAHPVTKGVTLMGFGNGFAALGSGTALANESGYEVLRAKTMGTGHVVIWGDEWVSYNDQWKAHPEYQVQQLWQNIVDWFNPGAGCVVPDPPPPK